MTDAAESDFDPEPTQSAESATHLLTRVTMYVVLVAALCVILWSLTQGGDRNLWTNANVFALARSV